MCILTNLQFRWFVVLVHIISCRKKGATERKGLDEVWQRRASSSWGKMKIPLLSLSLVQRGPLMWKLFEAFPFSFSSPSSPLGLFGFAFPPEKHFLPHFEVDWLKDLNANVLESFLQEEIALKYGRRRDDEMVPRGPKRGITEKRCGAAGAENTNSYSSRFQFSWRARRASILIRFDPCVGTKTAPAKAPWRAKQRQLKMKTQGWLGHGFNGICRIECESARWVGAWMWVCVGARRVFKAY